MKLKLRIEYIWSAFVCAGIAGNLIVNILYNMELGDITKYNVLLWLFLISGSMIARHKKVHINLFILILFVMLFGILGNMHGALLVKDGLSSLDNLFVNFGVIIVFFSMRCIAVDRKVIKQIMKLLVICGIITSVYAMVKQSLYFRYVFKRIDVGYNSWFYTSFLGQRNIFAGYCFLCSIAALYLMTAEKRIKNKLYYIAIILFGIQIYITNSRTALIAYLTLIGSYMFLIMTSESKVYVSGIIIILVAILLQNKKFVDFMNTVFVHITSSGVDSGSIRLNMWKGAIKYSFENIGLLFGFGIFPVSHILQEQFEYASTHNAYLDALLVGGIAYLSLLIYLYICTYKRIRQCNDIHYSKVMLSAFIAFLLYNIAEAGAALFTQNYFSVTSTVLFIILPYTYTEHVGYKRRTMIIGDCQHNEININN